MRKLLLTLTVLLILVSNARADKHFRKDRNNERVDVGEWQADKYGMFLHWGLYSLAAGEWGGRTNLSEFFMLEAKIPLAEMKALARTFDPVGFDAELWVKTAIQAGFKYMIITTKHHEGFAMYKSEVDDFNIVDGSPFGRDPIRELSEACEKYGLKFGVYYSLGRDWADPDVASNWPRVGGRSNDWDFPDEAGKDFSKYYERKLKPQLIEILTNYKIHVMWLDTEGQCSPAQSQELIELVEHYQPWCLVNDRVGNGFGDFFTPEQRVNAELNREPWESCITIGNNWGYTKRDTLYKSSETVARLLVDVVSKGGNLLLNVGPTPWGTLPEKAMEPILAVGEWLKINGEAVYGTMPWRVYGEDHTQAKFTVQSEGDTPDAEKDETEKGTEPDIRFTSKPGVLYIIARSWKDPQVCVNDLFLTPDETVETVCLLGYNGKIDYRTVENGMVIDVPPHVRHPMPDIPLYVFKVGLKTADMAGK